MEEVLVYHTIISSYFAYSGLFEFVLMECLVVISYANEWEFGGYLHFWSIYRCRLEYCSLSWLLWLY